MLLLTAPETTLIIVADTATASYSYFAFACDAGNFNILPRAEINI